MESEQESHKLSPAWKLACKQWKCSATAVNILTEMHKICISWLGCGVKYISYETVTNLCNNYRAVWSRAATSELSHALKCNFYCADQVGVTWWCGTMAHQAFPENSARLHLQPDITQLFIQPLPLLDSSSSTGYQTYQRWANSWTSWINQRLHISERNPKPTTAQAVRNTVCCDVSH